MYLLKKDKMEVTKGGLSRYGVTWRKRNSWQKRAVELIGTVKLILTQIGHLIKSLSTVEYPLTSVKLHRPSA